MDDLKGRKIAVLGAGVSGLRAALLAAEHGASVFVSDEKEIPEKQKEALIENQISFEENGNSDRIFEADEIIVSSGIPPSAPIMKTALEKRAELTGELDFAYPYLKGKIIAVTGSNGKTTTTSMIAYLLERSGYKATAAGNIGLAFSELGGAEFDYIAAELSSFQLYRSKKFEAETGIITNLAPDHIDWHGSYENYVASKAGLFDRVRENGACVCQRRDVEALKIPSGKHTAALDWKMNSGGIFMDGESGTAYLYTEGYREKLFDFDEISLLGRHNLENTAMALAALKLAGAEIDRKSLKGFSAPDHRCAYVAELNGVTFIDDSKGTNVAASVTAMSSLPGRKAVILGGQGKGEEYSLLCEAVKRYAVKAVLIGAEKEKIAEALKNSGFENFEFASGMREAVEKAYSAARAGETVLLSPACTSWDMYKNYGERGKDFCEKVKALTDREKNDRQRA